MNQVMQRHIPFKTGWFSFGLGEYRPCIHTYNLFPYESLPSISEDLLQGKLQWLTPLEKSLDQEMEQYRPPQEDQPRMISSLQGMVEDAKKLDLILPDAFLKLMASRDLQNRVPSCTACYFDLSLRIVPCPGSENGHIIRFLNDQQGCLQWYIYLTPGGEHCVLVSGYFLDWQAEPDADEIEGVNSADVIENTYVCSPSFEAFLYRFWIENMIWYKLSWYKGRELLTEEEKRYLSHYKPITDVY